MKCFRILMLLAATMFPSAATAQTTVTATPATPPAEADPDARVDALQPDFNLAALPTTLRMPVHKLAFRVTHRFNRPLGEGDFGDLASDFFGFDSGAQIGLELRYGLARGTQIGIHRTSDRTIQLFGQHNFWSQRNGKPLGLDAMATLEGGNNLREGYKSALGIVASRNVGRWAALYAEPFFVVNSNPAARPGSDNNTLMLGLGGRLRIRPCNLSGRRDHAAADGLRAGCESNELRPGGARGRPPVPAEYFERVRDDAGADCRRRLQQRQLVHRIQHRAEVLLRRAIGRKSCL